MESLQAEVKSEHPCKERWSQNIPARRGEVRTVNINFFINGNTIDTNYSVCIMYPGTWVSVNSFIQNRVTLPNMKNASQDCKRMQYQFCTRSLQMLEKQICGYNWTLKDFREEASKILWVFTLKWYKVHLGRLQLNYTSFYPYTDCMNSMVCKLSIPTLLNLDDNYISKTGPNYTDSWIQDYFATIEDNFITGTHCL